MLEADLALEPDTIKGRVGDLPDPPSVASRPMCRDGEGAATDPYKRIAPPEHFRRLAGITVPARGGPAQHGAARPQPNVPVFDEVIASLLPRSRLRRSQPAPRGGSRRPPSPLVLAARSAPVAQSRGVRRRDAVRRPDAVRLRRDAGSPAAGIQRRKPEPSGVGNTIAVAKRALSSSKGASAAAAAGLAFVGAAGVALRRRVKHDSAVEDRGPVATPSPVVEPTPPVARPSAPAAPSDGIAPPAPPVAPADDVPPSPPRPVGNARCGAGAPQLRSRGVSTLVGVARRGRGR